MKLFILFLFIFASYSYWQKQHSITLPFLQSVKNNPTSTIQSRDWKNSLTKGKKEHYDFLFIQELYQVVLRRMPKDIELSKWINVLSQGASKAGVYRGIILQEEYFRREQKSASMTHSKISYAQYFLETYVKKRRTLNSLQNLTREHLKRYCVERALEMIDELSFRPEALFDWYAIFSAELAEKFPRPWKSQIRASKEKEEHRQWATRVSLEDLKSEVIIKLHKAFDS